MPYVAPEVVQRVKQIDLLTYLKNYEPYELVHFSGNTYSTRTHDSLKISNGKWMWWSRGIGGRSALDYLIKVRGYDFVQAVQTNRVGGSVKNFVALVKNSSFLVRITDMTILIEKEFIYGSSKRPNPTDYYRK